MREGERQLEVNESEAWAEAGNKNASRKLQFNWNGVDRKVREEEVMAGQAAQHLRNWPRQVQLCRTPATGWRRINWSGNTLTLTLTSTMTMTIMMMI